MRFRKNRSHIPGTMTAREPEQPSGQEQPETFHYEEEKKEEHPFQDTDIWDEE